MTELDKLRRENELLWLELQVMQARLVLAKRVYRKTLTLMREIPVTKLEA